MDAFHFTRKLYGTTRNHQENCQTKQLELLQCKDYLLYSVCISVNLEEQLGQACAVPGFVQAKISSDS